MTKDSEKGRYTTPEGTAVWEYVAAINCSIFIFCIGCVLGWNAPAFGKLMQPDAPIVIADSDVSTIGAVSSVGFTLAPTLTVLIADKLGRKNGLLAAGIPMIVGWTLIAAAKHTMVLLVARFFDGLAAGLGLCLAPIYLGEIASVKLRGALGMIISITTNMGILYMFVTMPYISLGTSACICLSITTASMIGIRFVPESPYFLAMVGRIDEAEAALEKLRGKADVTEELELIKRTVRRTSKAAGDARAKEEQEPRGKFGTCKRLFTITGNRRALGINFLFVFTLHWGGYVVMMTYGQIIFEAMKTGVPTHLCIMIIAAIQLAFNVLTIFVVEKSGRRPLICASGTISGACVLVVGVYFYLMEYTRVDVAPYGLYAFYAMVVYTAAMNIGLMPLQMVIQSETFDTEVKALAVCLVGVGAGVLSTIAAKLYMLLAVTWGFGHSVPFLGFSAVTWISTALILRMLPETKGKTFLEIQRDLNA